MEYDAIVVGVGGMGSAACWQLARRGQRVLGLERYDIPHAMGSSHGSTRIIRLPYQEDPAYVPLLRRAYELWREIERESGQELLVITGSLDGGEPDGGVFDRAREAARLHDLPHEVLTGAAVNARFPSYALPDRHRLLFQPEGGFVASERAIVAHVRAALAHGATIRAREQVLGWEAGTNGVTVRTDRGEYRAERLVLAAGAWMGDLLPRLAPVAVPERQVMAWFATSRPEWFTPARFPVCNVQTPEGHLYAFPEWDLPGFKIGLYHHRYEQGHPDAIRRAPDATDEALLRAGAERYFPQGAGPVLAMRDCMFTNTPDGHFIVGLHPEHPRVIVASPCSGHGYKFCSVMGEILAELVTEGATRHDIGFLSPERYAA